MRAKGGEGRKIGRGIGRRQEAGGRRLLTCPEWKTFPSSRTYSAVMMAPSLRIQLSGLNFRDQS